LGVGRHAGIEKAIDSLYAGIFTSRAMPSGWTAYDCAWASNHARIRVMTSGRSGLNH